MKEIEDLIINKSEYEIMKFPKAEKIEDKDLNWAANILNVFNIPSIESRQQHLNRAKEKIWKVVKSIKTLNEKQIKKYLSKKYIMDPYNSTIRFIIDTFIVNLSLLDLVIFPFKFFVDTDNTAHSREIIFDVLFFIEIIANCFTGYYETTELYLITDIKLIILNYLRRGFIFDLLYTLPFWLITPQLIILRMIKIYRFPYIVSVIQQIIFLLSSFCIHHFKLKIIMKEIFSFGFKVLYILHVFSCVYIFIAKQYSDNWIVGNGLDFNNYLEIYISSVHMLTQTFSTTGYGDLKPINNAEILFMIISQAVCCGLFTYLITCILLMLISHLDTLSFKYKTQLNLYLWMTKYNKHLPSTTNQALLTNTVWDNVTHYFDLFYGTRNNFEWINLFPFLKEIKPNERKCLLNCTFENTILHFASFFNKMNQLTKNQIILKFKTHIQNSQVIAIAEDKKIKRVFLIEKGTVVVLKGKKVLLQLKEGQVFGLLGLINQYSEYSYEIAIDSEYALLFSISLKDLTSILSYDDESYKTVLNQAFEINNLLKQMANSSDNNDNHNYIFNNETMEVISQIPNYKERKRDPNERNNNQPHHFEGLELGNNDKVNKCLNEAINKEKELLDMELRLNVIFNQISYLNANLLFN